MNYMMEIREKTATLHKVAEHTGYIKKILDGNASNNGYAEYIFNLREMYKAIEEGLNKNFDNEVVKDFVTKELYRSELMEKDVDFLLGDKVNSLEILPSTVACVSRIKEISENKPELLVAYAYTRFFADLFGGRTFLSILSKKYGISNKGLNYYNFDSLGDIKEYVMNYHDKLGNINLSEEMKNDFVNEISNAYIYNLAISNELDAKLQS